MPTTIDYICGFLLSKDWQRIALIEKQRPAWMKGKWNGIGGKIEYKNFNIIPLDKSIPHMEMAREFKEKTGVDIPPQAWHLIHITQYASLAKIYYFFSVSDQIEDCQEKTDEKIYIFPINEFLEICEDGSAMYDLKHLFLLVLNSYKAEVLPHLDPEGLNTLNRLSKH